MLGNYGLHKVVINVFCESKVKHTVGLIVTVLTGRGPRSPGSIEFLFLIWTGYFNLGSSWLSEKREREERNTYRKSYGLFQTIYMNYKII